MSTGRHRIFRAVSWSTNSLLAMTVIALIYFGAREYSVRQYLKRFEHMLRAGIAFFNSPEIK